MPVGSDNISMQGIAISGSFEVQTNISLQFIWTAFVTANPSGGNLKLNDMANKDYPTVTTSAASSVTSTSMTCNGNVSSDGGVLGGITQRGFYFGTNASYSSNTRVIASGTSAGAYTLSRTSLTAGTTYYITSFAENALGERQGSTVSQATSAALTSFTAILDAEGGTFLDSEAACNAEEISQNTWYHDGSGTFPANGDNVYTNSGGTTSAPDGYIRWSPGRGSQNTNIESGVAGLTGIC